MKKVKLEKKLIRFEIPIYNSKSNLEFILDKLEYFHISNFDIILENKNIRWNILFFYNTENKLEDCNMFYKYIYNIKLKSSKLI